MLGEMVPRGSSRRTSMCASTMRDCAAALMRKRETASPAAPSTELTRKLRRSIMKAPGKQSFVAIVLSELLLEASVFGGEPSERTPVELFHAAADSSEGVVVDHTEEWHWNSGAVSGGLHQADVFE